MVTVRIPLALAQRLDRYVDNLETETGLATHRGATILRHALTTFLEAKGM